MTKVVTENLAGEAAGAVNEIRAGTSVSTPPRGGALGKDILASLVVFLVAVPLALGIALASGAPSVVPGLIACAVGGIVAGALGGARLQVSGPTAGSVLIIYGLIQHYGWPVVCAITAAAGILQILFGVLRVARACLAITPAVVHGMLAGVGLVIALSQAHIVLGGTPESSAFANLRELPGQIATLHGHSTFLGLLTIGVLFGWQYAPARVRLVPGALVAVLVSTLVSNLEWFDVKRVDLPARLSSAFELPHLPTGDWGGFAVAALTVALVASVESLLSAVASDKLHTGERANLDRELMGQGAANVVSGLIGGLPVTGVIIRSATNINAGAQSRLSTILHGVWIIVFVALFAPLIERVPLPTLAGLLVFVSLKLINPRDIRELTHHREVAIYVTTLLGVAFWNLLAGVGLGIGLSVVLLLRRLVTANVRVTQRGERWHVRVEGSLTFLSVPTLTAQLSKIPSLALVDVDLMVDFMDHAAFEALHGWRMTHEKMGGKADIDELHENWYERAAQGDPIPGRRGVFGRLGALTTLLRKRPVPDIHDLTARAVEFNTSASTTVQPTFSRLAREGQQPKALFIGCADSRIVPNLMTGTDPGDLFTLRNIGNIVPPCVSEKMGQAQNEQGDNEQSDSSVLATLEFAVNVLQVENIIVCGHSECGAMKALLHSHEVAQQPGLQAWLRFGQASLARYMRGTSASGVFTYGTPSPVNDLAQVNVMQQLDNLREYPFVAQRIEEGRLHLWGWFFDIGEAQIYAMDTAAGRFVKLDAQTAQALLMPPVNTTASIQRQLA